MHLYNYNHNNNISSGIARILREEGHETDTVDEIRAINSNKAIGLYIFSM